MEYLEGGTLHSLLSRLKGFIEDMARFYAAEIVLAVIFLHKCGIVHRHQTTEHTVGQGRPLQASRLRIVRILNVYIIYDNRCVWD